ncbi:Alpha 1,4-glycosyltransferase domain containing protein [Parasponia andersonii]|uniref:Alpha 1,4-glycosyltransferase domain containing protein n=1 Tax=Parasponia andersonii TaxID=3476 RepID=A0A2P5AJS4_PARAD|nr:Alpha 1,4-glycosyltransferase domain containing protein [Parasponia andersonii]
MLFDIETHRLPKPILVLVHQLHTFKKSLFAFLLCVPTSLLALLLLILLAYNGVSVFCVHLPFLAKPTSPEEPANFSRQNLAQKPLLLNWSTSSSSKISSSSSSMYVVREENAPLFLKTQFPIFPKPDVSLVKPVPITGSNRRTRRFRRLKRKLRSLSSESQTSQPFSKRMREFFVSGNCTKPRFFMTWISSLSSFGERESFAVESLFKSHPNACLAIVSKAMDSADGIRILKPFLEMGFRVTAVSPDYDYVFKNTPAETWFNLLRTGKIHPGEISLGQNLSNLLRLALLYKYGGVYTDTDVIFVRSFSKLKNVIGAQTIDLETGKWSRLNNAVLVFDKKHPLLLEFIKEFTLTFNGNKWGHNGPYLVSRVVSKISSQKHPGFNFTVLPPPAFYPVDWSRIQSLFSSPADEFQSKWVVGKLKHIRTKSFVVHLWNRQSKRLEMEKGSIIDYIKSDSCIFSCNSSVSSL